MKAHFGLWFSQILQMVLSLSYLTNSSLTNTSFMIVKCLMIHMET